MKRAALSILVILLVACPVVGQILPDMEAVEPVTKPATAEINYSSWFLKTLVIRSDNDTSHLRMIFVRYDYANKLIADSADPANVLNVDIPNAYERIAGYTAWQQAMGAMIQLAATCAKEQEVRNKITALDQQIEQAKAADPATDVSALDAAKATQTAALKAIIQGLGPIEQE